MKFAKAALFLLLALTPAHAIITPEFQLDAPVEAISARWETSPAVAFNGRVYVVAWTTENLLTLSEIHWKTFDSDGRLLGNTRKLPVEYAASPVIVSNGDGFLLTFQDEQMDTSAVRLDAGGNLVENSLMRRVAFGGFHSIASDGADYMLFSSWPDLALCRVTAAGFQPVTRFAGTPGAGGQIAFAGESYFLVWTAQFPGSREIHMRRVSKDGALLGDQAERISVAPAEPFNPSIAASQGVLLATWQEGNISSTKVLGRRIMPSGAMLDAEPITIVPNHAGYCVIGPHSDGFIATWTHLDFANFQYEIRNALISPSGTVSNPKTIWTRASPSIQQISVNAQGTNTLVAWTTQSAETSDDVFANFIPSNADARPTQILEIAPNIQSAPAATAGFDGYLVVWQDNRHSLTNADDILGAFLDRTGRPLSAQPFPIAPGANDQSSPAVAAAGDRYLVVWRERENEYTEDDNIRAALIVNRMVAKVFSVCTVTNSQRAAAVASNGRDFLVVWRDDRFDSDDDIYGAHISREGEITSPPGGFQIAVASLDQQAPAVASNGTNYLVVWRDSRNRDNGLYDDVYGAIVEAGDTNRPANFAVSSLAFDQRGCDVASNGTNYFVVWRDDRNVLGPESHVSIYGTPVSANGVVAVPAGIPLAEPAEVQREPAIVRSGSGYMVNWLQGTETILHLYGRQISDEGAVTVSPRNLSATNHDPDILSLASHGDGSALALSETVLPAGRVVASVVCAGECPIIVDLDFNATTRALVWNGQAGVSYRLEYKDTLNDPTWKLLAETAPSSDGPVQATDVAAGSTRFYRVVKAP